MKLLKNEKFKFYKKRYLISNYGRVFSLINFKFIKPELNNAGYSRFSLYEKGKKRKHVFVHLAVVELFGDYKGNTFANATKDAECITVDHLDKDRTNCRQDNLEIVTHSENCKRKFYNEEKLKSLKENRVIELSNYF